MKIVALDPGGTTGIAHTVYDKRSKRFAKIVTSELGPQEHHKELYRFLIDESPHVVVCERFIHQNRKDEDSAAGVGSVELISGEYIGVARLYCDLTDKTVVLQTPAQAKKLWTDDKLKTLDLWIKGSTHKRDAIRHLLYFITVELNSDQYVRML